MPSKPLVLGFDTSGGYCAAALLSNGQIIASLSEDMKRGQAERLMPLLEQLLSDCGAKWSDLDAIGVGVGPGNFTGIRISVSAARGLALALDIPAIGVTSFDATSFDHAQPHIPIVIAPRDQAYALLPEGGPELIPYDQLKQYVIPYFLPPAPAKLAENIAHIAVLRSSPNTAKDLAPATPFYIRAADAAPPRDPAPVILDDAPSP